MWVWRHYGGVETLWRCGDTMWVWRHYGGVETLWRCGDTMGVWRHYGGVVVSHNPTRKCNNLHILILEGRHSIY